MIGAPFVILGAEALREPGRRVEKAAEVGPKLAHALHLPEDPTTLVRINAGVQVAAGSLLSLGRVPRLCALALAGSLVPTTIAGHPFWEETDKQARAQQKIHFLKNLAMLGGLLLAVVDTGGRPSVGWRAKKAAGRAKAAAEKALPG